jgi:hypothetical protein
VVFASIGFPARSAGQTAAPGTVTDMLNTLFESPIPFNPNNSPLLSQADYERRSQDSVEGVGIGIGNAISSFPLGASSAGLSYVVDPATGERVLRTTSFGTVFIDRGLTNGRGVFSLGFSYQHGSYDVLQDLDLSEGGGFIVLSQVGDYTNVNYPEVTDPLYPPQVGDLQRAYVKTTADVFTFVGSYGVTDAFDIGWAVPIASLSVHGQSIRYYNGGLDWDLNLPGADGVLGTADDVRAQYPNKVGQIVSYDRKVDATGIGDVMVRAKYAFGPATSQGVAVSVDLRLPTGDEDNLLGAGTAAAKFQLSVSRPLNSVFSLHGSGGYMVGGRADEGNFGAAVDASLLGRKQLTLSFEFLGQVIRDTVSGENLLTSFDGVLGAAQLARRVTVSYGFWDRGNATLLRGAAGLKYQIGRSTLLTASALFRLNEQGYQAKIAPFVGIEHAFGGR